MPERRTIVMLGALVLGMTFTSGLLLLLEPGPVTPISSITLQSIDRQEDPQQQLFSTDKPRQWQALVIHDSGNLAGSAKQLSEISQKAGRKGLGYDFVIDNGPSGGGGQDGLIEVGYRWSRQLPGDYLQGKGANWFNDHAVGICMVGDADRQAFTPAQLRELVWLVQQLQARYHIPPDAVYVQVGAGSGPAKAFPYAWFRSQLLTARLP